MESAYQKIADIVLDVINDYEDWSRIVIFADYSAEMYELEFYVKRKLDGEYYSSSDIGFSTGEMDEEFFLLNHIILKHREEMKKDNDTDEWIKMTMVIEENGSCKVDYDYQDDFLTEDGLEISFIEQRKNWEEKYLI